MVWNLWKSIFRTTPYLCPPASASIVLVVHPGISLFAFLSTLCSAYYIPWGVSDTKFNQPTNLVSYSVEYNYFNIAPVWFDYEGISVTCPKDNLSVSMYTFLLRYHGLIIQHNCVPLHLFLMFVFMLLRHMLNQRQIIRYHESSIPTADFYLMIKQRTQLQLYVTMSWWIKACIGPDMGK